jgi:hypothetical protein
VNVPVSLKSENIERPYSPQPTEPKECNEQEVLDLLEILESKIDRIPSEAPPALLLKDELGVCPQSFINLDISFLMNLQTNCSEYHIPPYESVWLQNPNNVIEAFDSIKEGSNIYTRFDLAELDKKMPTNNNDPSRTVPIGRNRRGGK